MGAEVMDLPLEEKMEFEEGDGEMAFGSDILSILPSSFTLNLTIILIY